MGAFNAIDLQNDGIVTKKNFVYTVTSALNKLTSQSQIRKTGSAEDSNNNFNQFDRSNLSNKKSTLNPNNTKYQDNGARSPDKTDNNMSRVTIKNK